MQSFTRLVLTLGLFLPAALVRADVLLFDAIAAAPPNSSNGIPRPVRSMTMNDVRDKFGPPGSELPWVGDPPITRWVYDEFTVYFEENRVINAVLNR